MAMGRSKVRGVESVSQGAARALDHIVETVRKIESEAERVGGEATRNQEWAQQINTALTSASDSAEAHAASSEEVAAAAEEQGASTEEMAARAADLNRAAEHLRSLVQAFRV
jgi:methyl-accepting chemotaxis protein